MSVYIYRSALYCEPCADDIKRRIAPKFGFPSKDSCNYPQSYPVSITPQHEHTPMAVAKLNCDTCSVFLENSLTDDCDICKRLSSLGSKLRLHKQQAKQE